MIYSVLEQHTDGRWWYHGARFSHLTREDAEAQAVTEFVYQPRPTHIIVYTEPLPNETRFTRDFKDFYPAGCGGMDEYKFTIK